MGKWVSLGALIVVGLVVADILAHPQGTASAASGVTGIESPIIKGLVN